MLGFGSLGQFSLGEFQTDRLAAKSSFSQPLKKVGLSAAVIATTFAGFVPPPAIAAPAFTKFSEPLRKTSQRAGWQGTPFAAVPKASIFSAFSQPQPALRVQTVEQPTVLFEFVPVAVPFSGFMDFGVPRFARHSFSDQQTSTLFEVAPILPVEVPGGGTSRKLDAPEPIAEAPRRKKKAGLEPVKKQPTLPLIEQRKEYPLPPFQPEPEPLVEEISPLDVVDRDLIPGDLLGLQSEIAAAQAAHLDEQDARDIADILAILQSIDEEEA